MLILFQGLCAIESNGKAGLVHIKAPMVLGVVSALESRHPAKHTVKAVRYCACLAIQASEIFKLMQELPEDDPDLENMEALAFDEEVEIKGAMSGVKTEGKKSTAKARGTWCARSATWNLEQEKLEIDEEEEKIISETLAKKFEGAHADFLAQVRMGLSKNTYAPDEVILQQDDAGDFAILLASGSGVVEVNGMRVGEVQAGSLIGEAVLIGKALTRTATVMSVGEVTGFILQQKYMQIVFDEFPEERTRMEQLFAIRTQTNKALVGEEDEGKKKAKNAFKKAAVLGMMGRASNSSKAEKRARRASAATGSAEIEKVRRRGSTGSFIDSGGERASQLQESAKKTGGSTSLQKDSDASDAEASAVVETKTRSRNSFKRASHNGALALVRMQGAGRRKSSGFAPAVPIVDERSSQAEAQETDNAANDSNRPTRTLLDPKANDVLSEAIRRLSGDVSGDVAVLETLNRETLFKFQGQSAHASSTKKDIDGSGFVPRPLEEPQVAEDAISEVSVDSLRETTRKATNSPEDPGFGGFSDVSSSYDLTRQSSAAATDKSDSIADTEISTLRSSLQEKNDADSLAEDQPDESDHSLDSKRKSASLSKSKKCIMVRQESIDDNSEEDSDEDLEYNVHAKTSSKRLSALRSSTPPPFSGQRRSRVTASKSADADTTLWLSRWAKKLRKMRKNAGVKRDTHLAMAGRLTPLVPSDRSFISTAENLRCATPSSSMMDSRTSSRMSNNTMVGLGEDSASVAHYLQARSMYRRPVWDELFD